MPVDCHLVCRNLHVAVWTGIPTIEDARKLTEESRQTARKVNPHAGQPEMVAIGIIAAAEKPNMEILKYMNTNFKELLSFVESMYYVNLTQGFVGTRIILTLADQMLQLRSHGKACTVKSFELALRDIEQDPQRSHLLHAPVPTILAEARRLKIPVDSQKAA